MRQLSIVMSSAGLGTESDCSGKDQKQLYGYITDPSPRLGGHPSSRKNLVIDSRWESGTKMAD
jgi:hypothetical protein